VRIPWGSSYVKIKGMNGMQKDTTDLRFLKQVLKTEPVDYRALLEYGLARLPRTSLTHGDKAISDYFFQVSEIPAIPEEIRDFAIDVSVYAAGAYEYDERYKNLDPQQTYVDKIKPLLV
jgi:hypothetical protein